MSSEFLLASIPTLVSLMWAALLKEENKSLKTQHDILRRAITQREKENEDLRNHILNKEGRG